MRQLEHNARFWKYNIEFRPPICSYTLLQLMSEIIIIRLEYGTQLRV